MPRIAAPRPRKQGWGPRAGARPRAVRRRRAPPSVTTSCDVTRPCPRASAAEGGSRPRRSPPQVGGRGARRTVVTWLILPVVICLSQRLSHACASISNRTKRDCEWLIKSVIVYLIVPPATRITVVILELIRARNRDFGSGVFIGLENRRPPPPGPRARGAGEPRGESR